MSEENVIRADPLRRKQILGLLSATLITVALYLYFVQGFISEVEILANTSPQLAIEKLRRLRSYEVASLLGLTAVVSGSFGYMAARIYRTGQYPPPHVQVAWNTRLRTGRDATVVAALVVILALVVLIYGLALVQVMWSAQDLRS